MIINQWTYKGYRIDLDALAADYRPYIYEPGNSQHMLSYTPIVENKHGQRAAEIAAEKFIDERIEKKKLSKEGL